MVTASAVARIDPKDVMMAFAQYGFRKTSMEDIARAVNLSRQSIYKKFESKNACYNWSLTTYMERLYQRVFEVLETVDGADMDILEKVFNLVVGDAVELAKTTHGAQLLEDSLQIAAAHEDNLMGSYVMKLGDFLLRRGLADSPERAQDLAHLLITSSRGALVVATSRQDFSEQMHRILRTVLADRR